MSDDASAIDVRGAFAFLIGRTVTNRVMAQIKRIKNPRYALAAIFGIGYFWLVFFRPGSAGRGPREVTGAVSSMLMALVTFGTTASLIYSWLKGGGESALAFQPAEVQFLFTAPVSRRSLLLYKMVRSQLIILLNAVFWSFFMRRWGVAISAPECFFTAWGFFTALSLHRLGLALMHLPPLHGARRAGLMAARAVAATAVAGIVVAGFPLLRTLGTMDFDTALKAIKVAQDTAPLAYVLAPVQLIVAPMGADSTSAWIRAFAIVAGIVALHLVWVLSLKVPFEEAATAVSAKVAKKMAAFKEMRAGGTMPVNAKSAKRDWLPLSPTGHPAIAITWKNTVALIRAGSLRSAVMLVILLAIITRVMSSASKGNVDGILSMPYLILAAFTLLMGPRALRNDLRQDLLNLPLLKSYPLSGKQLVFAELASPTLVLTVFECLLLFVAYFVSPPAFRAKIATAPTAVAAVLIPLALLTMTTVSIGIQNALAVLFPSWVRLGADSGGFEAMGQNLLVTFGSLLALIIALIVPIGVTVAAVIFSGPTGIMAIIVAGIVAIAVLAAEIWWMVSAVGRAFERMDPSSLT